MSIKLVLPKQLVYIEPDRIVFFLAGPIHGGGDWQAGAIQLLAEQAPDAYVVCPSRYETTHPLYHLALQGESEERWASRGIPPFSSQTYWERYYLNIASIQGCIIFWLPVESTTNPRPPKTGPYAQDTYGELGEWRVRMARNNAHAVIGAERGFHGLSVIEKNCRALFGESFVTDDTLEKTIASGIMRANKKK
jgi:hypothetical protein